MATIDSNELWNSLINEDGDLRVWGRMRVPSTYEINCQQGRSVAERSQLFLLARQARRWRIAQFVFGCLTFLSLLIFTFDMAITMALVNGITYLYIREHHKELSVKTWLIWKFPPDSELHLSDKAKAWGQSSEASEDTPAGDESAPA